MIKKNKEKYNSLRLWKISLLNKILQKNLLKKKNYLLKKFNNKKIKYKIYKLLNLKILKKNKFVYINIYDAFYDLIFWVIFISTKFIINTSFDLNFLKYKKKNLKKKWKKKNIISFSNNKKNKFFLIILNYLYKISLLKYYDMFRKVTMNFKLKIDSKDYYNYLLLKNSIFIWNNLKKNIFTRDNKHKNSIIKSWKFLKYLVITLKQKEVQSNVLVLKNFLKNFKKIRRKSIYKIGNAYKKDFFKNETLNFEEQNHLKTKIFINKKVKINKFLKRRVLIIRKRIKLYFNKFFLKNLLKKKFIFKQRLIYYNFFFNSVDNKLYLINNKNNNFILWKNLIKKTSLRFRLSEYIFSKLFDFKTVFHKQKKIYFILNFYKIIVFFKNKLKNLKKYLLKKFLFKNLLIKNFKKFKYYYQKEFLIKFNLSVKNIGKSLNVYYSMLKYFNKIFFFLLYNLKLNTKIMIKKYTNYVYLSYLVNIDTTINQKNYISLVNINDYFMRKVNNVFNHIWLLNDIIFNYVTIYDKVLKEDIFWNNLSYRQNEKNYILVPEVNKNVFSKYTYFFNKKIKNKNFKKYVNNYYLYYIILLNINFSLFFNINYNKFYLLKYIQLTFNNLKYKIKKNYINTNINLYKNKLILLKNYLNFKNKLNLSYLNFYKKKLFILKLIILVYFYIYKVKYFIFKYKQSNFFFFDAIAKIKNFYTNWKNFHFFKNFRSGLYTNMNSFKNYNIIKKNEYKFKGFFIKKVKKGYYSMYSKYNKYNFKKCILHLVEKKTNNFLVLSLFDIRLVIGHTSSGQGLYRAYRNSKRQKKGTWILGKIIYKKLRLRARKFSLKEVFIKSNLYWNFRINFLTKYWVLRYKLGIPYLKGLKLGLGLPYHKGLRLHKRKRK